MDILLASGSPRRRELLTTAQLNFSSMNVDIDETPHTEESPQNYIQRMVATKACAAIAKLNAELQNDLFKNKDFQNNISQIASPCDVLNKPLMILTADTIGVLPDGKTVLVKPSDRNHAYSMWQQMSDNTHQIWTAVQCTVLLMDIENDKHSPLQVIWQQHIIERTDVTFVPLTADMMANYWASGEPADKAGAYGIQGLAAAWVTQINGSYTNVVGLPLAQTLALIKQANHDYKTVAL